MGCNASAEDASTEQIHVASNAGSGSNIKVLYFGIRNKAEPLRMMMSYANVPFEDQIVDFSQWPSYKKHFEF